MGRILVWQALEVVVSVIDELTTERGGNSELTRPGENFTSDSGATILGSLDLFRTEPAHASLVHANNVADFLFPGCRDGRIDVEIRDEVVAGVHQELRHSTDEFA